MSVSRRHLEANNGRRTVCVAALRVAGGRIARLTPLGFIIALVLACAASEEAPRALPAVDPELDRLTFIHFTSTGRTASHAGWNILTAELEKLVAGGYLAKPGGITVSAGADFPASEEADHAYSLAELEALIAAHRTNPAAGEALITVLYVDGHYADQADSGAVLGLAFGGDAIVIFADQLAQACGAGPKPATTCAVTEAGVLLHELGHLLGLVNGGTPMVSPHQDTSHGAHDANPDCIMYFENDRKGFAALIGKRVQQGNEGVTAFDAACLADLKAMTQ